MKKELFTVLALSMFVNGAFAVGSSSSGTSSSSDSAMGMSDSSSSDTVSTSDSSMGSTSGMPSFDSLDADKDGKLSRSEFDVRTQGAAHGASGEEGMQSDEVMKETEEHGGGPTMLQGGENAGPKEMTPEQTITTTPGEGSSSSNSE